MTARLITPRWYCKYCYGTHPTEVGADGSRIVCTNCGAGLAPADRVVEAGSLRSFCEQIEAEWMAVRGAAP